MGWREVLRREFFEADREFVTEVLPLGRVDSSVFGLLAEATRYVLVQEGEEVHIRPDTTALGEVLRSLARGGRGVTKRDAEEALQRFAALWESKARARGTWEEAVRVAREAGEIQSILPHPKRRFLFWRG
ncbi:MAG: hypothetical protein NZ651_02415 [Candidatus Bipolaricaulota bacterium]|nr:hypothetical protein [Candidatus Bipolaricaulota bacterium]MDW8126610.1 hypothetical protein [Candidatus Bipolaricaulota bacterium]